MPEHKTALLDIATAWMKLAETLERKDQAVDKETEVC
jgi:hypothetical protein